jgi:hypothetical protein
MLPFGVTIPATVPQRSEIPERLTNCPVFNLVGNNSETLKRTDKYEKIVNILNLIYNNII